MRRRWFYPVVVAPLALMVVSVFLGKYPVFPAHVLEMARAWAADRPLDEIRFSVIFHVRLPRALLAAMVGGSLAACGAAFQSLFRNPLVSSGMLGVSSGAGFGAALALILFNSFVPVCLLSFGFGLLAVGICFAIARFCGTGRSVTLVLGGVVVGTLFSALISFLKFAADPYDELPAIVFWLMGSLSRADYSLVGAAGIPMLLGCGGLMLARYRLNVLAMGDRQARALGVRVNRDRAFVITCATLATAGAVCVSGVIGWIGLVVPHMGRMIIGNNNRFLVPVSFSLGACFLMVVDDLARIIASSEIPLGVLTALVGGPFFICLLKQTKAGQW